jgi:hypothetical protein
MPELMLKAGRGGDEGGRMSAYKFFVFTNAKPGREDEFNSWYSNVHVQDVLTVPGFRQAQRFELEPDVSMPSEWRYLVIYEIETDDLKATLGELKRRHSSGQMPLGDAMEPRRAAYAFRAMGPVVVSAV